MQVEHLPADTIIYGSRERTTKMYVVTSGEVALSRTAMSLPDGSGGLGKAENEITETVVACNQSQPE